MQYTPNVTRDMIEVMESAPDVETGLNTVFELVSSIEISMSEYQEKTAETAIYPEAGTGSITALSYVGLGLGEVGEVQGKIKKVIRDDGGVLSEEKRQAIIDELGDVLWYASQLATELEVDLEHVARRNLRKLASRKDRGQLGGSGDER